MNALKFIRRGIWHYKLSYLGVGAGAVLGATVLLGALIAGDSVKETLREVARQRVGEVDQVFVAGEGFFRDALATDVATDSLRAAPILFLRGQLNSQSSERGLGRVQILGVDDRFWGFAPGTGEAVTLQSREVAVNDYLAQALDLKEDDSVILRLQEPGMLSRDAPLSGEAEDVISFRAKVRAVVGDGQFGRFNLQATQLPVPTVFVPLSRLQQVVDQPARANLILLGAGKDGTSYSGDLAKHIRSRMRLLDYGLSLVDVPLAQATEIRSARIFFEAPIVEAVRARFPETLPVTSYLINTYAANGKETPYSMVAAVQSRGAAFLPELFSKEDIVINDWLAEDLALKEGQEISLAFFKLVRGNELEEATAGFRVRSIVAREGLAADQLWMPDFPGVAEAEDAQDWAPGLPLDLGRIRQKDEDYWDEHRGTPKAFISEERGRELFGNRWGEFTSLRVPTRDAPGAGLEEELLPLLQPGMAGLLLRNLGEEAQTAARSPVDIAGLFLSMSFFLIVASVALTAMLFRFNIEQRNRESGLLAALGVPAGRVLRWRLMEGLMIVTVSGVIGLFIAIAYSVGILRFLETIWSEDSAGTFFAVRLNPVSMVTGLLAFITLSMSVIWLTARKQARKSATLRLEAGAEEVRRGSVRVRLMLACGIVCVLLGAGCILARAGMGPQAAFFLSGTFLLVAGLLSYRAWLGWNGARSRRVLSSRSLAALNSGRRPTRSLVVVGIMACGVFLVIAVTAFRKHGGEEWAEKSSGAGGFAFWVETTNPINRAADAKKDPDYFELGDQRSLLGEIRPFRMGVGDDASCFNLNTATRPRLLATDVGAMAQRGAFTIREVEEGRTIEDGWNILREPAEPRVLRAFVDQTTMMWVLKKKVGDRITYQDERGEDFEVEITGALADSIFQGNMIVDEAAFLRLFPSQEGYRLFLADVPGDPGPALEELQKATADRGSTVTLTRERLEGFHGVENTYIAIFHVLGGLGLILGSAGLGIVTARNLAERREEFGILQTIGIPHRVTRSVIFKEVRAFIGWAFLIGLLAALVAILPALSGTPPMATLVGLGVMVGLIGLNSMFWAFVGYVVGYRRRAGFGG
ncbi:MAG: hypothetical protein MK194_02315 [Roseibacillus sp.]|nr:hypothetical protein [Roseibacillus sp.]